MDKIIVKGARENNLKNIDIEIPKNKLTVITGVSGSGKSSLAFDTIYAEGERRYVESLSSYARQFLGGSEKPDVDSIDGLSPSISIDQKTTSKNPRSTVGTVTEIYDYLRLLYARVGSVYCPNHNIEISSQSVEEMTERIMKLEENTKVIILSPVVDNEKGEHKDLIANFIKDGFVRARIDKEMIDLSSDIKLEKNKKHKIDLVIDRLVIKEEIRSRLFEALELAVKLGNGKVIVDILNDKELILSSKFACPHCDFSLPELEPIMFSFNSPYGACEACNGIGVKLKIDPDLLLPNPSLSIREGVFSKLYGDEDSIFYKQLECFCNHYKISLSKPFEKLSKKEKDLIFYGSEELIHFKYSSRSGNSYNKVEPFEGVINSLERRYLDTKSEWLREWLECFMIETKCEVCNGKRLNEKVLSVKINNLNIAELCNLSIKDALIFFENLKLDKEKIQIAKLLLEEIKNRLVFLKNVGLDYLTLSRTATSLSGGESQRIRLATQVGSKLTGVLYVLDEPSIGLHQRDNDRLINTLMTMRDIGNTLIVVEHDEDMMLKSDYLIDIGPFAGDQGGEVIAYGTPEEVMKNKNSLTGNFLSGREKIEVPKTRKKPKKFIEIKGAKQNNLKNIDVKIPLGVFTCVTGVSGSGKSSLIMEILSKKVQSTLYKSKVKPGEFKSIKGLEHIDKLVEITQDPIGRTPRSNPVTYTGIFDDIRNLFAETKEAKIKGFGKDRFSFNVKGGRCEACRGDGVKKIEMNFLPDVYVTCEVCKGKRYNSETLNIKYKNKTITDVLEMRVSEAIEFFENIPKIHNKLKVLEDVGLSYIKLGQIAPTLSGGEASRVKLAKELQKKPTGKTLYIMDEPTTGLHSYDIKRLLAIIKKIVDNDDSVIVIEHNLDVIKSADYIIDIGLEGGDKGGEVVAFGTPEEIIKNKDSITAKYLKEKLEV